MASWQQTLHEYFVACVRQSQMRGPDLPKQRALMLLGTPELINRQQRASEDYANRALSFRPPDPDEYVVVESSESRMVVELGKGELMERLSKSRYRLVRKDGWLIADIYRKCVCDDGSCQICEGSGKCMGCGAQDPALPEDCLICTNGLCFNCQGHGECDLCRPTDMPGWTSEFRSLRRHTQTD
ncbi:MAG: hypothetical protein NXI04_25935 [Planctomycetaceae bacterium]|nr:hypothetical protein [Planctomycetaceae bacterium]